MNYIVELIQTEQFHRVWEEYWPWVLGGIIVIAKWVRSRTLHWRLWPGVAKILGLVIEILDFIHLPKLHPSQADIEKAKKIAAKVQDPAKKKRITDRVEKVGKGNQQGAASIQISIILAGTLFMTLILCSCATWTENAKDWITTAHRAGVALRENTMPLINQQCSMDVDKCIAENRQQSCPEYEKCEALRNNFAEALKVTQVGLKNLNELTGDLEKLGGEK